MIKKQTLEKYSSPDAKVFCSIGMQNVICGSELTNSSSNNIEEFEFVEW